MDMGAEMGINEYGVSIGNEAVFTKSKTKTPSLIGMDFIRLALERTKTAKQASEEIIRLLLEYGQGETVPLIEHSTMTTHIYCR